MSTGSSIGATYLTMTKPPERSTLYRMIEAGQLVHHALLAPLHARGLEAGDDALILALGGLPEADEEAISQEVGLDLEATRTRIARLIDRDIVTCRKDEGFPVPKLELTERGQRMHELISANWTQLEEALFAELPDKRRKGFDKSLKHAVRLLRQLHEA